MRHPSFSPSVSSFGGKGKGKKGRPSAARSTAGGTAKEGEDRNGGPASSQVADGGARDDEYADEDEEGADDTVLEGGGLMSEAAKKQEQKHTAMLMEAFSEEQLDRYSTWRRVKLKKETVRKITNQTLSQSVPASIVTAINGYTKVFIGEIIEMARDVQAEWLVAERMSKDSEHPGAIPDKSKEKSKEKPNGNVASTDGAASQPIKTSATPPSSGSPANGNTQQSTQEPAQQITPTASPPEDKQPEQPRRQKLLKIEERDRGPLTPNHLREAIRRYKKDREGGSAGFQGLSMLGRETTASRVGGRRLFR